jgi:phosphatidate cytidylyltransferase
MLRWRLILSAVLITALTILLWLDARSAIPGAWLLPVALLLTWLATSELLELFSARGFRPIRSIALIGNLAIVASNYAAMRSPAGLAGFALPMIALALAVMAAFAGEMARYRGPGAVIETLGLNMLALGYIGVLFSFVVQLRLLGPDGSAGIAALLSLVLVVKMSDSGAYLVGRLIGRRHVAPLLSPGKTLEGCLGGLAFALVGAWLTDVVLAPKMAAGLSTPRAGVFWWIGFGLVVGLAGMMGDLAESLIKRDVGRKDSSTWMPGFGGTLDVLDSILMGAPVAYLFWLYRV